MLRLIARLRLANLPFRARVVRVPDGDSLVIQPLGWAGRIYGLTHLRMIGLDAPEFPQPAAPAARHTLTQMVAGRTIWVFPVGRDPYGRILGGVRCNGSSPARSLIRQGLAFPTSLWTWPDSLIARLRRRGVHGPLACMHPATFRRLRRHA